MKTLGIVAALAAPWLLATGPAAGQERAGLFPGAEALVAAALADERGGESAALHLTDVIGTDALVQDNTVVGGVTGNNYASDSAFSGASGFSTLIQNSGNHVIIQNATIINLSIGN